MAASTEQTETLHVMSGPFTAVRWTLSKQRDWLAQSPQTRLNFGVISGDRDLPRSPPPLEGSERLLLPLIDPLFKVKSLS